MIYMRYVLDEIRDGTRDPRSVGELPSDLAGYYAEQIERWRGDPDDEADRRRWEGVRLPLLGALAAARAPLTVAELATFAGAPSPESARTFIEETVRPFLSRRDDPPGSPCYALRHQSLRDLLTANVPEDRPDLASLAPMLGAQTRLAHARITTELIPPGAPSKRDWDGSGPYARHHLAAHAGECDVLDSLVYDPGFLLTADPGSVLAQRARVHSPDS